MEGHNSRNCPARENLHEQAAIRQVRPRVEIPIGRGALTVNEIADEVDPGGDNGSVASIATFRDDLGDNEDLNFTLPTEWNVSLLTWFQLDLPCHSIFQLEESELT